MKVKSVFLIIFLFLLAGGGWWFFRGREEKVLTPPSAQPVLTPSPFIPPDGFRKLISEKRTVKVLKTSSGIEISVNQSGEVSFSGEMVRGEVVEGSILSFKPSETEASQLTIASDKETLTFEYDIKSIFYYPEGTDSEIGGKLKIYYREKNGESYVVVAVGVKK